MVNDAGMVGIFQLIKDSVGSLWLDFDIIKDRNRLAESDHYPIC
jgi:hypothetical protein